MSCGAHVIGAPCSIRSNRESQINAEADVLMLALDPNFKVLISHGLTDVQTPYFGTQLLLDQIPDYGPSGRLKLKVYSGGHMHYSRDESRKALREDARQLIEGL